MSYFKYLSLSLLAFFCTVAKVNAANLVALWDKDFKNLTFGSYQLDLCGNTLTNKEESATTNQSIIISQVQGMKLSNTVSTVKSLTVLLKTANLPTTTNTMLCSVFNSGNNHLMGIYRKTNEKLHGIAKAADYSNDSETSLTNENSTWIAFQFNNDGTKGTRVFSSEDSDEAEMTQIYNNTSLLYSNDSLKGMTIGGFYNATNILELAAATGWEIEKIMLFEGNITAAELKEFKKTSLKVETLTNEAYTVTQLNELSPTQPATFTLSKDTTITLDTVATNSMTFTGNYNLTFCKTNSSGDASIGASDLTNLNYSSVQGVVTFASPISFSPIQPMPNGVTYTAGIVSNATVALSEGSGGKLTLIGGENVNAYRFNSNTWGSTLSTVVFSNATVATTNDFGLGMAEYTLAGTSTLDVEQNGRFILSQGNFSRTSKMTLKDSARVSVNATTNLDSNVASIMFGHWNGSTTFTMQDNSQFVAPNTDILIGKTGNNHTINLNGGTMTVRGIAVSDNASGTNKLNLNGGTLVLKEGGIRHYGTSKKLDVTVASNTVIKANTNATIKLAEPMTVNTNITLTLTRAENVEDTARFEDIDVKGEGTVLITNVTASVLLPATGTKLPKLHIANGGDLQVLLRTGDAEFVTEITGEELTAENLKVFYYAKEVKWSCTTNDNKVTIKQAPVNGFCSPLFHLDFHGDEANRDGASASDAVAKFGTDEWSGTTDKTTCKSVEGKAIKLCNNYTPWWGGNDLGLSDMFPTKKATFISVVKPCAENRDNRVIWSLGQKTGKGIGLRESANNGISLFKWNSGSVTELAKVENIPNYTNHYHFVAAKVTNSDCTLIVDNTTTNVTTTIDLGIGTSAQFASIHGGAISGEAAQQDATGCYLDDFQIFDYLITDEELKYIRSKYRPTGVKIFFR